MGILGDKMLIAGVVSKADADRIHRQEIIEKEKIRKEEARREAQEEARWQQEVAKQREDRLRELATLTATMSIKDVALVVLGISKEDRDDVLMGKPRLETFHHLGVLAPQIVALMKSDVYRKSIEEERDRLLKSSAFRRDMQKFL